MEKQAGLAAAQSQRALVQSAKDSMAQKAKDAGGVWMESTKINSGGRRYDLFKEDGSKVSAYSRDLPDSVKTGDRDALIAYILGH